MKQKTNFENQIELTLYFLHTPKRKVYKYFGSEIEAKKEFEQDFVGFKFENKKQFKVYPASPKRLLTNY